MKSTVNSQAQHEAVASITPTHQAEPVTRRATSRFWSRFLCLSLSLGLFLGAGVSLCQAGLRVSRTEEFITASHPEIEQRATNALKARGFILNMSPTSCRAGIRGDWEAVITYNVSERPGQVVVNIIIFVASDNGDVDAEREALRRLMNVPAGGLVGTWNTDNVGLLTINQNGSGSYMWNGQQCTISGTFSADGRTLTGRYFEPGNASPERRKGTITLTLNPDGKGFTGAYGYGNDAPTKSWNGSR
ncbi:MAG: hypothetical protein ABIP85_27930 [Chthoniobacteraceae bacterium]